MECTSANLTRSILLPSFFDPLYQWVNHYNGYNWAELVDLGMDDHARDLGWTEATWNGDDTVNAPLSDNLNWDELSEDLKEAADHFCYFWEIWDRQPITIWQGVSWPEYRYYPWSQLDQDERELLTDAGYTQSTWDTPETAPLEDKAWSELKSWQRERLREYGFYEAQWDCFMNHYADYDWFELVLEGVATDFETLGWTEEDWYAGQEPSSYDLDYDDLTESQQDALWEICYFRETWNGDKITEWDDDVRSGSAVAPGDNSEDESEDTDEDNFGRQQPKENELQDSGDSGPSIGVIIICLVVALLAGFTCGRFSSSIGGNKTGKDLPKEGPVAEENTTADFSTDSEAHFANNSNNEDEKNLDNYEEEKQNNLDDVRMNEVV